MAAFPDVVEIRIYNLDSKLFADLSLLVEVVGTKLLCR